MWLRPDFHPIKKTGRPGWEPSREFSESSRELLIAVAHAAVLASVERQPINLIPPSIQLAQRRGVFTTLYIGGRLRGCVGYVIPTVPLYQAVGETARSAALEDSRFAPVTSHEVPQLAVSLSVLSPLTKIEANLVEVGRHGLLISQGEHRGLLLPQVPTEYGWDRLTFLEETCRKASLPPDAWERGAKIECFTAEVFGDHKSLSGQ